jgi:hypothetical protein
MGSSKPSRTVPCRCPPKVTPQKVYAGNVPYQASNGWHITVFNDANEWDYVEEIRTQGGDTLDFDDLDKTP